MEVKDQQCEHYDPRNRFDDETITEEPWAWLPNLILSGSRTKLLQKEQKQMRQVSKETRHRPHLYNHGCLGGAGKQRPQGAEFQNISTGNTHVEKMRLETFKSDLKNTVSPRLHN